MGLETPWGAGLLVVVLVVATAAAGLPAPAEEHRRVIITDLETLKRGLGDALAAVDGELVRTDDRLGFAVAHAPPEELSRLIPGHVVLDRQVQGPELERAPTHAGGTPDDPFRDRQWTLDFLDMQQTWTLETGSQDVTVAVVDSGLDADHEDLAGLDVELGTDYVEGGTVDGDPHGHGTHITGIISGLRGNGIGITGMSEVSLMNIRVLDEDNVGWCSDFYSGVAEAAEEGADVINYSIGGLCLPLNLVGMHATITANDALLVGITHNYWDSGSTNGVLNCLLVNQLDVYPNVMAVTAIDEDGEPTSFSCRAPWADVAAPGASILSTVPYDDAPSWKWWERYQYWWGTSMAAPHVAATAALMKSANPDLTAQELRALIVATADDAGDPGYDTAYGHGILDPDEAVQAAIDHPLGNLPA